MFPHNIETVGTQSRKEVRIQAKYWRSIEVGSIHKGGIQKRTRVLGIMVGLGGNQCENHKT